MKEVVEYTSRYKVAHIVAATISIFGWIVIAFSLVVAGMAIANSIKLSLQFIFLSSLPGFVGVLSGLGMVTFGQLTRATLDSADYSGEMLAIMKKVHRDTQNVHGK